MLRFLTEVADVALQVAEEVADQKDFTGFTISPSENEKRFQVIEIDYDVNGDKYVRKSNGNQIIPGWKSMAFQKKNVFRKEEFDHRMRYLSRTAGSSTGLLAWKVDLRNTDLEVEFVDVLVNSKTFENGSVRWNIVSGPFSTDIQPGWTNNFQGQQVGGSKELTLKAILTGGRGAYAWQHAQLFRSKMNSNDTQFKLMIKLRRANPGFQPQGVQPQGFQPSGFQILPTENEMRYQVIEIDYDVNEDHYTRRSNGNQVIRGWKSMAFQVEDVFRKEEFDHRMRYLSRTAGSSTGFLSWKVDLRNSDFEVEFIDVLVNSTTFENGSVHWKVVSGTFTTDLQPGRMNNFHNQQVGGSKELTLKAFLTGGRGAYAWQHAQLFRTKMNSSDIQFKLLVKLRRANPGFQPQGFQPQGSQPQGFQPPGNQPPGYQQQGFQPPGYQPPGYQPQGFQPPGYQPPGYQPPGYQPPGYQPPGYQPPGYQPQGYQPPGYQPSAPPYQPPGYQPQAYQPQAYQPPTCQPPVQTKYCIHCNSTGRQGAKQCFFCKGDEGDGDEAFKKIADIERKSFEISQKFIEIQNQVWDIENGHLPREHHLQALKDLEKKCKMCSESWMKILVTLDGIELNPDQSMAKNKRKAVANATNANMDAAEEVIKKIYQLRT